MSGKLNFSILVQMKPKGNKKIPVSTIYAKMGSTIIASRAIPGRWTEQQALEEFRKAPERFNPKNKEVYTPEILRRLAA